MNLMKLVWSELLHRKSQVVSGILAITLGIGVIVGIQSVTRVSEIAVALKLDNLGANILVLPQAATVDDYYTADIDAPTMPGDYVERVLTSALPGVDNLSPKLTRRMEVGGRPVVVTGILPANEISSKPIWQSVGLVGADLELTCDPNSAENRSLGYEDERLQRKVVDELATTECLVGSAAALLLDLEEGATLAVADRSYTVDKVLPETGTVDDDRVFLHLAEVQAITGIEDQVSSIEIMGCCNAISDGLLSKLRNILPDTRITTVKQIVSTQLDTNALMKKVSMSFLFIVLFVGAISIGNYMWANVNERRREIGVLRMLGTPRTGVYGMLLAKALILGLIGGLLGYVLGTVAGMTIGTDLTGLTVRPVPIYLLWSVLLSVVVALIGCLVPAWLAGRIEPFANMQEV
ncbi:MAG: ABC transporter permease [Planctomycetota bacterium]|jgi:putative ABC transport system permease protein